MCLRLEEFTRSRESHVFQSESCGNTSFSALTSIPKQQCETVLIKMITDIPERSVFGSINDQSTLRTLLQENW